jgi:carboxyl-terminal processing protease
VYGADQLNPVWIFDLLAQPLHCSSQRSAVASLGDPHTEIITPTELQALRQRIKGNFSGIGIAIKQSPDEHAKGPLEVIRVFAGGPAEKAGVRMGDVIIKVNGDDISNKEQTKAVELIRGPAGTDVSFTVRRGNEEIDLTATRAQVKAPVVDDKRLEGGIAYIALANFVQDDAAAQVKAALLRHSDAKAYVLDLRNNPGGSVAQALQIASLFVGDGNLVSFSERAEGDWNKPKYITSLFSVSSKLDRGLIETKAGPAGTAPLISHFTKEKDIVDKPVVILVNENSASSSELTAAAIHDNGAGTIMGTKTFGKGVAQLVIAVENAAVKVTQSRYYTPNNLWVGDGYSESGRIGIEPDIVVTNPKEAVYGTATDEQLTRAVEFLKDKT